MSALDDFFFSFITNTMIKIEKKSYDQSECSKKWINMNGFFYSDSCRRKNSDRLKTKNNGCGHSPSIRITFESHKL